MTCWTVSPLLTRIFHLELVNGNWFAATPAIFDDALNYEISS